METKDIRSALERLSVLAERWQNDAQSGAIERDLILDELRRLYDMVLFAAPHDLPAQPDTTTLPAADAATGVAMVDMAGFAGGDAEDIELLDLESGFDEAPVSEDAPEATAEPEPTPEPATEPAPEPEVEEPEVEEPSAAEEPAHEPEAAEAPVAEPAAGAEPESEAAAGKTSESESEPARRNLLFDLGPVQHRTRRRMMSLYDDDMFDRLPDTAAPAAEPARVADKAAAEPVAPIMQIEEEAVVEEVAGEETAEAEVYTATEAEFVDNAVEPEVAPAVEAEYEEEPEDEPDDIENYTDDFDPEAEHEDEPEYEPETVFEPESGRASGPEQTSEPEPEPETETEPEPESEPEPQTETEPAATVVRTLGDMYAEPSGDQPAATTVLGDVMNSGVEVLGDTLAPQTSIGDTLAHAPVKGGLKAALDISDRYQIIAELFGGDADACDAALEQLDAAESLEDAIIYIEENFRWSASSAGAAIVMDLLDRKFS